MRSMLGSMFGAWMAVRSQQKKLQGSTRKRHTGAARVPDPRGLPEPSGHQREATKAGHMSGYEPPAIDQVAFDGFALMFGRPGAGLSAAGFGQQSTQLGQEGEQRLARALASSGLLDRMATFWSISMPDTYNGPITRGQNVAEDARFNTDVDCVIYTGRIIYLVDVKNYPSGALTYHSSRDSTILRAIDDETRCQVGKDHTASRNMEMALHKFKKMFPNKRVEARIVFVPREQGEARFNNVLWPGRIPGGRLSDFITELQSVCESRERVHAVLPRDAQVNTLKGLLR